MDEINYFLQTGNKKIVNIQVVKDIDAGVTVVINIFFYEDGADFTF